MESVGPFHFYCCSLSFSLTSAVAHSFCHNLAPKTEGNSFHLGEICSFCKPKKRSAVRNLTKITIQYYLKHDSLKASKTR